MSPKHSPEPSRPRKICQAAALKRFSVSPCLRGDYLGGLTIQKLEGLLVADPVPDSIQRSITRQASADCIGRLVGLCRQRFNLAVNFLIADFDFFLVSEA